MSPIIYKMVVGPMCAMSIFAYLNDVSGAPRKTTPVSTEKMVFLMNGNDKFSGGPGNDIVDGGPGNDTLDGGTGRNTIYYLNRTAIVAVTLNSRNWSTVRIGNSETDKIRNFQNVIAGSQNDSLTGDQNNNVFEGGPGSDYLNGASGFDTASYAHSKDGVTASLLSTSLNTGDAYGDSFIAIENLEGSQYADLLIGDHGINIIQGNGSADTLTGNGGNDIFRYNEVADSKTNQPDLISDFYAGNSGEIVDLIDLSQIDADSRAVGKQSFVLKSSFSGNAGELIAYQNGSDVWVDGDTLGSGSANFRIILEDFSNLSGLATTGFKL